MPPIRNLVVALFAVQALFAVRSSGQSSLRPAVIQELQRGEAALKANDQASAARSFRNVLLADPHNLEAHANLGAIAFFQGDCATAEQELRDVLTVSPTLIRAKALLSLCERRRGDPAAQAALESAFAQLDEPKLRLQVGVELANGYFQQGDLEHTAATLHTLLTGNPENVDLLFFAQRVYTELADTTLNKLAVLSPNSARMEQLIAERLINAGDLKDAATHYRNALGLNDRLPGLHYELAETLLEDSPNNSGTRKAARAELAAAIHFDGDTAKTESQLGRLAMLEEDLPEALDHYRHAYKLSPTDSQAQLGLAELLRRDNKPEEAASFLRMAVQNDPFNPEAHYKLSQIDRQLNLAEESKKELQLFLDLRAARDKVKLLYRQMNPQTAAPTDPTATAAHP